MILIKIPRKDESFFRNVIKRAKRLAKSSIGLEFEVFFGQESIFILFPSKALHLIFARAIQMKCEARNMDCPIYTLRKLQKIPQEYEEIARHWTTYKLKREHYKLRDQNLDVVP